MEVAAINNNCSSQSCQRHQWVQISQVNLNSSSNNSSSISLWTITSSKLVLVEFCKAKSHQVHWGAISLMLAEIQGASICQLWASSFAAIWDASCKFHSYWPYWLVCVINNINITKYNDLNRVQIQVYVKEMEETVDPPHQADSTKIILSQRNKAKNEETA